jgi:hypothetical protein
MKLLLVAVISVVLLFLVSTCSYGQDNHYAWMQYGSRNAILYNAGISRFEDQSAVIINPATLAEAKSSSFNFNTNMVGFNSIKFKDGLGQGFTVSNSNLNVLPSMASGVFKPSNVSKNFVIGYALYHANTDNLNFTDRSERKLNLINETESPGDENYLAQYTLDTELDEFNVVGGVGWRPSERLTIGGSLSFIYRTNESREAFTAYALSDPAQNAAVDLVGTNIEYYAKYNSLMSFAKLGLTYKGNNWDLGLVISSPTIGIFGSGKILANYSVTNYRVGNDLSKPRSNFLANGLIEKVKATYKYPLSVAVGASRAFGKVRLYGSFSWYNALSNYTVMDPGNASFVQPANQSNVFYTKTLRVWSSNKAVYNGSIAVDWELKPENHLLFSFRNDQHYGEFNSKIVGNNLAVKQWDNWHFTIGNQREFKSSALVLGLRFNYGSNNAFPQPASFSDPSEGNLLQGERDKGKVTSSGIQLLLSYTFALGKTSK